MRVLLIGLDVEHRHVGIEQERYPIERRAATGLHARREKMAMAERLVRIRLVGDLAQATDGFDGGRRVRMIEERRGANETLVAHELLGVQAAVRLAERRVAFSGNLAECVIDRHQRFPRSACSRSIASKSALKLPAPKLFAPLRWITS